MKKVGKKIAAAVLFAGSMLYLSSPITAAGSFEDVSTDYWAYDEIKEIEAKGIVDGFPDGKYRPEQPVTRAQSAVMIGKAMEVEASSWSGLAFEDVTLETSGHEYISALVDKGVFQKAHFFNPGDSLTRAQMAKILTEAFDLEGKSMQVVADVDGDHWAHDYVQALIANDITTETVTFQPSEPVNRAQLAVFVKRILEQIDKPKEEKNKEPQVPPVEEEPVEEPEDSPKDESDHPERMETMADIRNAYSGEMNAMEAEVLRLVNEIREEKGLNPLTADPDAVRLARFKSEDMRDQNYFAHESPIYGSDIALDDRFNTSIFIGGANIAGGNPTAESVVQSWMESDGHRQNILREGYKSIGIGLAEGGNYRYYWTQLFVY